MPKIRKEVTLHHTKAKADIGVAKVIADLVDKGYVACIPLSEHQPYDLIAMIDGKVALRLQVKYATLKQNETIDVKFRTSWTDRNGTHTRYYGEDEFDYYAIYCPEKNKVIYVPNNIDRPAVIRFGATRNNQGKYVRWADDYSIIKRKSSETIRRTPEMVKT